MTFALRCGHYNLAGIRLNALVNVIHILISCAKPVYNPTDLKNNDLKQNIVCLNVLGISWIEFIYFIELFASLWIHYSVQGGIR